MKNASIVFLIMLSLVPMAVFAQQEDMSSQPKQLGLTYSTLGGAGIYYLYPAGKKDNLKFTGIYIYRDENDTKESYFSIGFEYQRDLVEDADKRGYFTVGSHIDNQISNSVYFSNAYDKSKTSFFSLGVGLGFDIGNTKKGIVLNAHVSYQLTNGLGSTDRFRVGLGGGVGIGFNF